MKRDFLNARSHNESVHFCRISRIHVKCPLGAPHEKSAAFTNDEQTFNFELVQVGPLLFFHLPAVLPARLPATEALLHPVREPVCLR